MNTFLTHDQVFGRPATPLKIAGACLNKRHIDTFQYDNLLHRELGIDDDIDLCLTCEETGVLMIKRKRFKMVRA